MAVNLWGNVYYRDRFAGILKQEPDGRCVFTYDPAYLEADGHAIAHTLALRQTPHTTARGLHPFFDNLVAEGWLKEAQTRALGAAPDDRFALLLAFGRDCAGAVSIIDPDPNEDLYLDPDEPAIGAALASRASLSGVQPKLMVVKDTTGFRPARAHETSTHIAKLPSGSIPEIIALEWLTTEATRSLLAEEAVVEMTIAALGSIADEALFISRFDRTPDGQKLHFEEFNQLLGNLSEDKYDGGHEDMGRFIRTVPGCIPAEAERLYRRILACFLLGNTDAHLKNFAMFHTAEGFRLTPCYDMVASAYFPQFDTIALSLAGASGLRLGNLQAKHIVALGQSFGLSDRAIRLAVDDLGKRLEASKGAVSETGIGSARMRDGIIKLMEKRWNGTFASIGRLLSKRRGGGARRKSLPNSGWPRLRM